MMASTVFAEKRVALVIGNATYKIAPLKNPVNDASSISSALSQLGFEVTTKLNANKRTMKQAISKFGKALAQPNTVGLFYFAGHGIQVKNRNYLIPINSTIEGEADVEFEGIDAGRILGQMESAGNNLNLVILDACRDNPFGGSFRSAKRGLARVNVPKGSMILYAASPGERAADGTGKNGVFTQNLLSKLKQPGLTVDQVFKQTASAVYSDTGKAQLPYREGSIIGEFYFKPGKQQVASISPKQPVLTSTSAEDTFIKYMNQEDPSQMALYLQQYPAGKLSALFKLKLKSEEVLKHTLTVRSNVNGDTVFIDGKNYGASRLDLKLKAGEHTIKIEKEGYKPFVQTIQLASNQTVRGILSEVPAPPQTNWESTPAVVKIKPKPKPTTGRNWKDPNTGIEFVRIPKGCFNMGSPSYEEGRYDNEKKHNVCIQKSFWMSKYEITNAQFRKMKSGHNSKEYKGHSLNGSKQPAVYVSWDDATEYAEWLSDRSGHTFRLPTEAEWEYAARGKTSTARYWGDSVDSACRYANVRDKSAKTFGWGSEHSCNDGYKVTAPVGQFKANAFGLHDMLGNVWEWTCTAWSKSYDGTEKRCVDSSSTAKRVLRGGSWGNGPRFVRSAMRAFYAQGFRNYFIGFRLLRQ